ncbi:MAG: thioesterase family protein, partial [Pseudomonadota bacterium]
SRQRTDYAFWTDVTIRYSDQDPMGHVNNVAIAAYFESGRMGLLEEIFRETGLPDRGMVLARLAIDYLHEITMDFAGQSIAVGGRLARVGGRSMTTHYALFKGDKCCAVSESVNVFFNPETRKSSAPGQVYLDAMNRYSKGY